MRYIFKLGALAITAWLAVAYGGWCWVLFVIAFFFGFEG